MFTHGQKNQKKSASFVKITMISLLASVAAASVVSWGASAPVYAASSLQDLQQQQQQIQQRRQEVAAELAWLKEDQAKQLEYKQKLDEQAANLQAEIDVCERIIAGYNQQIAEKEAEIADVEAEIDALLDQLKERIRASYLAGEASTLEVLLNAENFFDLAEKAQVAQSIAEHDKVLIDELVEKVNSITVQKHKIEDLRNNVAWEQSALERQKAEVQVLIHEAETVLENLKSQEDEANSLMDQLANEMGQAGQEQDSYAGRIPQNIQMIDEVSAYDLLLGGSEDTITVTSSNERVAAAVRLDGADTPGVTYRLIPRGTGEALLTVTRGGQSNTIEVVVYPKGGSITLDTVNYRMAPGNIYDIGVTVTDGEGNPFSGEQVQQMVRDGVLRVTDSRTGSIVDLEQLPNGNFRVTGKKEGTCWITYEVIQNGEAVTHASVKVDVAAGAVQGGSATRDTSWWAEKE